MKYILEASNKSQHSRILDYTLNRTHRTRSTDGNQWNRKSISVGEHHYCTVKREYLIRLQIRLTQSVLLTQFVL
jgi:hypothetical protein